MVETNLGDLVTDSMLSVIDSYQPEDSVDVALQPTGFIRESIHRGTIKTSDAFSVLPLGVGLDMEPGYPLVSFYLTIQEIKRILEISLYLALSRNGGYLLQVSGLRFWYNPLRPILEKVTRVEIWDSAAGQYLPLDASDTKNLYKVGTNLFVIDLLPLVKRYLPRLTINPKDRDGNLIPLDTRTGKMQILVDRDPATGGVQELKEWQAFIGYLSRLPDWDGDSVPDVPARYAEPQGRINRPSEAVLNYQSQRKNPWIGVGAALIVPSLGHAYAQDWFPRGLTFLLLELGSLILASQNSTSIPGLLAFVSLKAWECQDGYRAVLDYNKKLAEKYQVQLSVHQNKARVALSCRF